MAVRNYSNSATEATLTASITAVDTTFALTSFDGYPPAPFTAAIERGLATEEIVLVTAVVGSTVTVTRGYDGTTAKSHASGSTFLHVTIAKDYTEANGHHEAVAAHGTTSAVVGVNDTQTLRNKTLVSPTLQAAALTDAATAESLTVTTLAVTGTLSAVSASLTGDLTVAGTTTLTGGSVTAAPSTGVSLVNRTYADAGDASTLASAKTYADSGDAALDARLDTLEAAPDWADLTVSAGWTAGFRGLRYRVIHGVCYFFINTARGTWTAGSEVATFPSGARPTGAPWAGIAADSGRKWEFYVDTAGKAFVNEAGTGGLYVSGSFPVI